MRPTSGLSQRQRGGTVGGDGGGARAAQRCGARGSTSGDAWLRRHPHTPPPPLAPDAMAALKLKLRRETLFCQTDLVHNPSFAAVVMDYWIDDYNLVSLDTILTRVRTPVSQCLASACVALRALRGLVYAEFCKQNVLHRWDGAGF
mmetsp:Transcript_10728/g.35199  ORF Transcript_10728/g.35199 Transcript_10728/m.35199 type:complete len:146 (-) Transcript_10728:713-1150(-)